LINTHINVQNSNFNINDAITEVVENLQFALDKLTNGQNEDTSNAITAVKTEGQNVIDYIRLKSDMYDQDIINFFEKFLPVYNSSLNGHDTIGNYLIEYPICVGDCCNQLTKISDIIAYQLVADITINSLYFDGNMNGSGSTVGDYLIDFGIDVFN